MLSNETWNALARAKSYMKGYIGKKYEHPTTKERLTVWEYTLCGQLLMINDSKTENYSFWEDEVKEMKEIEND